MKLTPKIVLEIASHEAIIRSAYKDSVGVWTWSAGITSASGHSVERYIDNPQTMQKCLEIYVWLLGEKYAPAVDKAFAGHALTEAQYAAALSFHWNTGAIATASWVKQFKAGDISAARESFMAWKKPPEIIPRRQKERDLFFDGKWSSGGKVGEYTRLTGSYSPVWSSRVNVDIRADVERLLAVAPPAPVDHVPVATPSTGGLTAFIAMLAKLFGGKK